MIARSGNSPGLKMPEEEAASLDATLLQIRNDMLAKEKGLGTNQDHHRTSRAKREVIKLMQRYQIECRAMLAGQVTARIVNRWSDKEETKRLLSTLKFGNEAD
jgi:hypothetical protein